MITQREGVAALPKAARRLKNRIDEALGRGDDDQALRLLQRFIAETESDDALRELWAAAQQTVGDVLARLDAESAETDFQEAIRAYRAALQVYTRDSFPAEYAMVQNNLGNIYRALPSDSAEEHEANLDRAIAAYGAALTVRTRDTDSYGWARTQNNLGNAHAERRQGDRAEHQRLAIASFRAALEIHDVVQYPQDHAMDQTNLGITYQQHVGGVRVHNLDQAMECFLRAMLVHTAYRAPRLYQRLVLSLADAFLDRMELTPTALQNEVIAALDPVVEALAAAQLLLDLPEEAEAAEAEGPRDDDGSWLPGAYLFDSYFHDRYRLMPLPQLLNMITSREAGDDPALRVGLLRAAVDRDDVVLPSLRAGLLDELGVALLSLPSGNTAAFQEQAIQALQEALDACPRGEDPDAWGTIQNHLAAVFGDRISGDRAENLERALEHCAAAVESRPEGSPDWAMMICQLGQLYRDRRFGDSRENCDQAIACFEAGLRVWTRQSHPFEWARTKNSLGLTLTQLRPGDAEALEAAIQAYEEALTVITRDSHPYEWAGLEFNLASALVDRIWGDRAEDVERAIRGHTASLSVRTQERYPVDWARTQHNLGQAYRRRPMGDKDGNLRQAAEHFRAALEVLTLNDRPADHRTTAEVLGVLEGHRGRWYAAHEAFAFSAAAEDLLLTRVTTGPHGFDDVIGQGHAAGELDAFALARLDRLEEAVQAVERGRTRWVAETLTGHTAEPHRSGDLAGLTCTGLTVHDMASGVGQPVVYLLSSPWGGLALTIRAAHSAPEVLSWPLPDLTDTFVGDLVQQTLPDGSNRLVGGYGAAQEGSAIGWLVHQWPGDTFAEKAAHLHAACQRAGIDATLDAAAQAVLAMPHPGLAELVHGTLDAVTPDDLSRLAATFHHELLRAELHRCLTGLAEVAMKPLTAALLKHGISSLILIPCGLLPGFPLTAAPVDGAATVADRLLVTVAPSVRSLLETPDNDGVREGVYTLGDPRPTHQELRWGEAEALTVAELAGDIARARVREAATRAWLAESLRRARMVLTSCHGEFNGRDFLRSRLLLAGGEELTLGELLTSQDRIAGLSALVMSACQTAVMDLRGAYSEVRSLAVGMLRAGARAVVAPLWAVDDRATYLLMVRFAQEWLPVMDQEGPAGALARAQSWLRTATHRDLVAWEARAGVAEPGAESDQVVLAAVRGRGYRYTATEAEQLMAALARRGAAEHEDVAPYADPIFWAGFQVNGR